MSRAWPLVVLLVPISSISAQLVWTKADDGRAGHAIAWQPWANRAILFGGANGSGLLPDTWEWQNTSWIARTPQRSPPARRDHAMAAGPGVRIVLFGGIGNGGLLGDTWEWDGNSWAQKFPAFAPTPRGGHAMAFDAARNRTVLFGGSDQNGFPGGVWEWDGTTWTVHSPFSGPPPRRGHGLAFDVARGITLLFGGRGASGVLGDTWGWNGAFWIRGTPPGPPARHAHAMAYDHVRQRTVLVGGTGAAGILGDTWEHDGSVWTARTTPDTPAPRTGLALAYDGAAFGIVLHGGLGVNGYLADSWVWDGTAWREPEPVTRPAPRNGPALAFDEARGRTLLFGGSDGFGVLRDSWEFDGVRWLQRQTAHAPPNAGRMAYDALRQRVVHFCWTGSNPLVTETWEWDGADWIQMQPANPPRVSGELAFDRVRGVTVLVANANTYEWDGIDWRQRSPASTPPTSVTVAYDETRGRILAVQTDRQGQQPFLRTWDWNGNQWNLLGDSPISVDLSSAAQCSLAYDRSRQRTILLGANGAQPSVLHHLEWDGATWRERLMGTLPVGQYGGMTVGDTRRGRVVLFTGRHERLNDTWECYTLAPASFATFGRACAGSTGIPLIQSSGELPWTGTTHVTRLTGARPFTSAILLMGFNRTAFAGGALPFSLAPLGAPECELWVPPELALATNTSVAGTAGVGIPFPDDPLWIGVELFQQFAVLDPGANALGLAFSNAGAAVVGAR